MAMAMGVLTSVSLTVMKKAPSNGQMAKNSKATGNRARWKARVSSNGPTILHMKAFTSVVSRRARENSHIQTELFMWVSGKLTRSMGKEP